MSGRRFIECFTVVFILACVAGSCRIDASVKISLQGLRVEGMVLDQTGAPIAGARVSLSSSGSLAVMRATTDAEGRFVFDNVTTSEGTLSASASGFAIRTQSWRASENAPLKFVLAPTAVTEEIAVTATRSETRLGDTAASLVELSSAELATTATLTIDDALRQIPGFQLFRRSSSRSANPTSQGVSLRGVGASGASRALVLLDGIPLNDPFGGWIYWNRVPREAINRIEVLRGAASNLYGSSALGGVVQIFTRKAQPVAFALETSYGNQATPDVSLFISGNKGGWGASIAAGAFSTSGYVTVDERERGRVDTPAGSRHLALDLTLEREFAKRGRAFARGSFFNESRANGTPLQTNRTHIRQFSAGVDLQPARIGSVSLRAYGGTQLLEQNFSAIALDRNSETLTRSQRVPVQSIGLTSQWSRIFGKRNTLVAGLDAREVRGASDEQVFVQNKVSSLVGAGGRERTIGVFVEDIVRINERLLLTGGLRFDRWRNYRAQSVSQPIKTGAPQTVNRFADRSETAFSPQVSALYKLNDSASLFASAYRAFRQPTLNELYRSFRVGDALTIANERLRAERLTGGEVGARGASFAGKLTVRGTLFWTEIARSISNVTLSVTPNLITRERENLGRTRSRGLEIESEARLADHWTIASSYLFVDARVLKFPSNRALEGLRIPQVARHQLSFQARYANPSLLTLNLQGRFAGAQFDDDQNLFRLKRYFTLDAFASRRVNKGAELFVAAENLFNQRYEIGRTPVTTLAPGRLLRIGFRMRRGAP
jgi:outer membrane receptor protein involved in Fe transport